MHSAQDKIQYFKKVRSFIVHCMVIHSMSKKECYRSMDRLKSIDRINSMLLPIAKKPESFSVAELRRYVIMLKNDLYKILPIPTNASYNNSLKSADEIVGLASSK